ncbi:hypothetical protein FOA52_003074 [Chlamydomonas sp. UWO 241]|nr:hypothetical protein FOA52_003074 [Chlamydomonas sp. UWO 241]
MMSTFAVKKNINKQLREVGVKVFDSAAVNLLTEYVISDQASSTTAALDEFIRAWKSDGSQGDRLTPEGVESVLVQLRGGRQAVEVTSVINAFDVPKISYDAVGRKLYHDTSKRSIFAQANSKQQLYIDRLHLISQRIRRNDLFMRKGLTSSGAAPSLELTDIQSLKGVVGARKVVLACISRAEDGRHTLEDHSGHVPLDLKEAQTAAGFYTENCIVIAEGEMHADGAFHASAVGFPPCETRGHLPMAAQRLNFFGGPPLTAEDAANLAAEEAGRDDDRLLVLANVHLDKKETLDALNDIFTIYCDNMEQLPSMIVLMGNFHSKAAGSFKPSALGGGDDTNYIAMRDAFDSLAALVEQFPRLRSECRFVFVPGPGDPAPSGCLPQPALPAFLTGEIRRVLPTAVFASNPCRIRYLSKDIVLFRYDILARMRRRCLIAPQDSQGWLASSTQGGTATQSTQQTACTQQATAKAMWGHLTMTLLQQSHLCPLPLLQQPIYWQYDHALSLYPLPHAVIVADSSPQASHTHEGTTVFNPGSFADGLFSAYKPFSGEVEENEVPRGGYTAPTQDNEEYDAADGVGYGPGAYELEAGAASDGDAGATRTKKARPAGSSGSPAADARAHQDQPLGARGADARSPYGGNGGGDDDDGAFKEDGSGGLEAGIDAVLARRAAEAAAAARPGQTDQEMWDAVVADDGGDGGGGGQRARRGDEEEDGASPGRVTDGEEGEEGGVRAEGSWGSGGGGRAAAAAGGSDTEEPEEEAGGGDDAGGHMSE